MFPTPPLLYEDSCCFVVDKPSGMLSVPPSVGRAGPTLRDELADRHPGEVLPVHRLDRGTSGCLLFAKDPAAHAMLQEQFRSRAVEKIYLAIVAGVPRPREAVIDAPIGRRLSVRTRMSLFATGKRRSAQTTYRVLEEGEDASLLSCVPRTGRTHQIRVHLEGIGHPVLGDGTYATPSARRIAQSAGIARLCLHARALTFTSPATGERVRVVSSMPGELQEYLERLEITWEENQK